MKEIIEGILDVWQVCVSSAEDLWRGLISDIGELWSMCIGVAIIFGIPLVVALIVMLLQKIFGKES